MKKYVMILVSIVGGSSPAMAAEGNWIPPIGIPTPPFGIEESHEMYSGVSGYMDAGSGPYTTYVDNTHPDCTDSGAGTASSPLCSIPTDLSSPGTVVEIHGGPYDYGDVLLTLTANGTQTQPVFVRGVDDGNGFPVIANADKATLQGSFFIIENLVFDRTQVRNKNSQDPAQYAPRFIAMRNLEVMRHPSKNGTVLTGTDIVFYNNHVHHHQGDDRHGTSVRHGSERVWIIDNYYHHNGGDAIQFCHGCFKNPPIYIYIGRNLMHSDRENGIDLKYGKNIVVSQNTLHSYAAARKHTQWCFDDRSSCGVFTSGSDGSAIVLGSDGAPVNTWIIFNDIHSSVQGIRVEAALGAWLIGNNIHGLSRRAIALEKKGDPLYIIGNTIYDAATGIDQYWRDKFSLQIHNNIFANIRGLVFSVGIRVASKSTVQNNLFWNNGDAVSIQWGRKSSTARNSSKLNSLTGGSANLFGDPRFTDPVAGNFHLQSQSAAIDSANIEVEKHSAQFRTMFGGQLSLNVDFDGQNRPIDGDQNESHLYDIGSYEFVSGPKPKGSVNLSAQ